MLSSGDGEESSAGPDGRPMENKRSAVPRVRRELMREQGQTYDSDSTVRDSQPEFRTISRFSQPKSKETNKSGSHEAVHDSATDDSSCRSVKSITPLEMRRMKRARLGEGSPLCKLLQ